MLIFSDLKKAVVVSLDSLFLLFCARRANEHRGNGVLFVRLDAIGDFTIWISEARRYRAVYPEKRIGLLCNEQVALLAKELRIWDEIIPIPISKLYRLKLRYTILKTIVSLNYEGIIHPVSSRNLIVGDSIVRMLSGKYKIGVSGDYSNQTKLEQWLSNFWYTFLVPRVSQRQHEVYFNRMFSDAIGVDSDVVCPSWNSVSGYTDIKIQFKKRVVVCLGASVVGRVWPAQYFAQVIQQVLSYDDFGIIFVGTQEEKIYYEKIRESLPEERCVDMIGKLSLVDAFKIVGNASLVIGNESSIVHFAAAQRVPSICIAGGGHFNRFVPYPKDCFGPSVVYVKMECYFCNWHCTNNQYKKGEAFPCVGNVSTESVMAEVQKIIDKM